MKTVSIGIMREDGDFAVLATLNNNDEHLSVDVFKTLVEGVRTYMEAMSKQTVIVLERQDTPDYVTIEEK
jgi:hypothetical protein